MVIFALVVTTNRRAWCAKSSSFMDTCNKNGNPSCKLLGHAFLVDLTCWLYMYIYIYTRILSRIHTHIHIKNVHIHIPVHMHIHAHGHIHTHCVYIYFMYPYIHIHTYIYVYIHTYDNYVTLTQSTILWSLTTVNRIWSKHTCFIANIPWWKVPSVSNFGYVSRDAGQQ